MKSGWKLGRLAGIDLYMHWTFPLLLLCEAMESGLNGVVLISAVFGCVVLHELGHAMAARGFGIPTRDITLYPFGGIARLERMPRAPGAEFLIAIAGPAVNFVIAGTLVLAMILGSTLAPWARGSALAYFATSLLVINVWLGLFNLLPAFPMDGGRILRALLSIPLGRLRATEIAATLGKVLAVVLPLGLIVFTRSSPLMPILVAFFIYFAAGAELASVREEEHRRRFGEGVWTAEPGYQWVPTGNGTWQLVPIVVPTRSWERSRWL